MMMNLILMTVVAITAIMVVFQAIGSCADDTKNRPGLSLARVGLAFLMQAITVVLAVILGRGI